LAMESLPLYHFTFFIEVMGQASEVFFFKNNTNEWLYYILGRQRFNRYTVECR
jgi:hypothetical protein